MRNGQFIRIRFSTRLIIRLSSQYLGSSIIRVERHINPCNVKGNLGMDAIEIYLNRV